jgi:hypothetical protein
VSGKKIVDIIKVFVRLNFFFHFFLDKKVEQKIKPACRQAGLQKNAPDIATLIGIFDKNCLPRLRKTSSIN